MDDAQRLYEESRALLTRGQHAEALAHVERALALDPQLSNGHNFAGWILMSFPARSTAQLEAAVSHFEAALKTHPDDGTPLVNLADALLALGRGDEAARRLSEYRATPQAARADNWVGWYLTERDLPRAIEVLERAARAGGWWGPAHLNLARAYEMAGRDDDAYEHYRRALISKDSHDPARCHARRAAIEERRGWIHHALSSLRRARVREQQNPRGRDASWASEDTRLSEVLSVRREYYPSLATIARWLELELAAGREGLGLRHQDGAPSAHKVGNLLRRARAVSEVAALDAIERVLVHLELPFELADHAFELDLAVPELDELDAAWIRLHYFLYDEVLEGELPADPVEAALRDGRVDEAVALVTEAAKKDPGALVDAIGTLERAGEQAAMAGRFADARKLLALVLDGYQTFASWSSSGGEGMARMLDVNRLKQRLKLHKSVLGAPTFPRQTNKQIRDPPFAGTRFKASRGQWVGAGDWGLRGRGVVRAQRSPPMGIAGIRQPHGSRTGRGPVRWIHMDSLWHDQIAIRTER